MTLPYIYQSTHSISFPLSALTHSISLPCKMDGKEGQSVDADFWHPVESISHQHRCSKFLIKSRIIWSNYDHDQKSRLHLVACNQNQWFALHAFHVTFHIFHCTHYCIARISRMSRILHFTNSAHFMHCTAYHVILCIISCHFIMKIHFIVIHII